MAQNNPYPTSYSQLNGFKRFPWAMHTAWGYPFNLLHNVIETTGAYTHPQKKISNGTAGAVLGSTTGSSAKQVITANITQPDVPRVLAITISGSGFSNDSILITGYNIEGKLMTDTIAYTGTGQVAGALVFRLVSSVTLPSTLGASASVTVDTTNKIGLNHRLVPNKTSIVSVYDTALYENFGNAYTTAHRPQLDANPSSSNTDNEFVEKNWVQPAHAPDGTTFYYFFYWFYKVLVYPPKDSPDFFSTTTSTSTSSTSTSTSFSSTSTSVSSTSSSTSISSTSTSSTSTSTTTLPV